MSRSDLDQVVTLLRLSRAKDAAARAAYAEILREESKIRFEIERLSDQGSLREEVPASIFLHAYGRWLTERRRGLGESLSLVLARKEMAARELAKATGTLEALRQMERRLNDDRRRARAAHEDRENLATVLSRQQVCGR